MGSHLSEFISILLSHLIVDIQKGQIEDFVNRLVIGWCQTFNKVKFARSSLAFQHFGLHCLYGTHAFSFFVVHSAKATQKCQLRRYASLVQLSRQL